MRAVPQRRVERCGREVEENVAWDGARQIRSVGCRAGRRRESGGNSAAQGVEVAEAGSRGGLRRGSAEALRAGSWRISAESEVTEKSREPEMFSRGGVVVRLRGKAE